MARSRIWGQSEPNGEENANKSICANEDSVHPLLVYLFLNVNK